MLVLHPFRRRVLPLSLPLVMNCCFASSKDASKAREFVLPSSLTSPPIKSIVEPGECQFSDSFTSVPLLENTVVSPTSFVLRFGLPNKDKGLGLSTCACLLAGVNVGEGEDMMVKPYTPISTNEEKGTFDLLIKKYPDGKMSTFLSDLEPSTKPVVSFKHIPFNVKIQYPFKKPKHILMIAGGTGIAPMIQALHALLGEEPSSRSTEKVTLLYGSRSSTDILGEEMLTHWAATHSDMFTVTHVLSDEENKDIVKERNDVKLGLINKEIIESSFPGPDEDVMIFVCGPPPMYKAVCGSKKEPGLSGVLAEMGYNAEQVYKF